MNNLFSGIADLVKNSEKDVRVAVIASNGDEELVKSLASASFDKIQLSLIASEDIINIADDIADMQGIVAADSGAVINGINALVAGNEVDCLMVLPGSVSILNELKKSEEIFASGDSFVGLAGLEIEDREKLLFITDVMGIATPSVDERVNIVKTAVDALKKLKVNTPKAAMLAAVEVVNPGLPVTVEAEEVAQKSELEDAFVEGPLSMDVAVNEYAAKKKKKPGEVPGKADLLVASNITVARGVYQAAANLCGADAGVVVVGGKVPVASPAKSKGYAGVECSLVMAAALA